MRFRSALMILCALATLPLAAADRLLDQIAVGDRFVSLRMDGGILLKLLPEGEEVAFTDDDRRLLERIEAVVRESQGRSLEDSVESLDPELKQVRERWGSLSSARSLLMAKQLKQVFVIAGKGENYFSYHEGDLLKFVPEHRIEGVEKPLPAKPTAANVVTPNTEQLRVKPGAIRVEYNRFVLFRAGGGVTALCLRCDPRHGADGVTYEWYRVTDGSGDLFNASPPDADAAPNPAVEYGRGETREKDGFKGGVVAAGSLELDWSKGDRRVGWLYRESLPSDAEIYPGQFGSIDDFSGKLDSTKWLAFGGK